MLYEPVCEYGTDSAYTHDGKRHVKKPPGNTITDQRRSDYQDQRDMKYEERDESIACRHLEPPLVAHGPDEQHVCRDGDRCHSNQSAALTHLEEIDERHRRRQSGEGDEGKREGESFHSKAISMAQNIFVRMDHLVAKTYTRFE
jgi:hypothetical protein